MEISAKINQCPNRVDGKSTVAEYDQDMTLVLDCDCTATPKRWNAQKGKITEWTIDDTLCEYRKQGPWTPEERVYYEGLVEARRQGPNARPYLPLNIIEWGRAAGISQETIDRDLEPLGYGPDCVERQRFHGPPRPQDCISRTKAQELVGFRQGMNDDQLTARLRKAGYQYFAVSGWGATKAKYIKEPSFYDLYDRYGDDWIEYDEDIDELG